jgi:ElaB/YqjD/DUF883 family membrane-anchored ribosome-binding protein
MSSHEKQAAASSEFDKAADTMRDIQRDLQVIRDDLARLAQQVGGLVTAGGGDAVTEVKAQLNRVRDSLEDILSEAREKGFDAVRDTADTLLGTVETSVRTRPIATLGVALGLGFLFGATWRR